jgi:hypothetical protein
MEEMMSLDGNDLNLKLLADSFPTGYPRVEKRDEHYLLILESKGPRDDAAVVADGTNVLAQMVAIMLKDGPNFRRPRIRGISKQNADGTLTHFINATARGEIRISAMVVTPRLIGPDGEIVQNKGPTEDQVALELARNNEPFRRAQVIYGSLDHDWVNLYKVLDAMREAHGDLSGLKAKNFVPAKDIENFKATAGSFPAIGLKARHGKTKGVIQKPRITLEEAQEMFRKLFQGWIKELKDSGNS